MREVKSLRLPLSSNPGSLTHRGNDTQPARAADTVVVSIYNHHYRASATYILTVRGLHSFGPPIITLL